MPCRTRLITQQHHKNNDSPALPKKDPWDPTTVGT